MNKLAARLDNPLDTIILRGTAAVAPALRATCHTPNVLTTYSFAFGLAAVWAVWTGHLGWFAVTYALSYVFDCADGQFARRYGMTSRLGDWYDHVTDNVVHLLLLAVVLHRRRWDPVLLPLLGLGVLTVLHLGCQQRQRSGGEWETLDVWRSSCGRPEWIEWTRFFGNGTFVLATLLVVLCEHERAK